MQIPGPASGALLNALIIMMNFYFFGIPLKFLRQWFDASPMIWQNSAAQDRLEESGYVKSINFNHVIIFAWCGVYACKLT